MWVLHGWILRRPRTYWDTESGCGLSCVVLFSVLLRFQLLASLGFPRPGLGELGPQLRDLFSTFKGWP